MPTKYNFPIKLIAGLIKHALKTAIGDDTVDVIAEELIDAGEEGVISQLDRWLNEPATEEQLKRAIDRTNECFAAQTKVPLRVREAFSEIDLTNEPELQKAINNLPRATSEEGVRGAIVQAIQSHYLPPQVSSSAVEHAVEVYLHCLRQNLLPLKNIATPVVGMAILRIEQQLEALPRIDQRTQRIEEVLGKVLVERSLGQPSEEDRRKAEDDSRRAEVARRDPLLYEFLKWKYGTEKVFERCGELYPVVVFPAPETQREDVNSVLLSLDTSTPKKGDLVTENTTYRSTMKTLKRPLRDLPIYTLIDLEVTEKLGLKCGRGHFFTYLDTSLSLEWELLQEWAMAKPRDKGEFEAFDRRLRLREDLHRQVANPVRDGRGRRTAIGVLTLIAFVEDSRLVLWLWLRSGNVAFAPFLLHTIPSGMFQPVSQWMEHEFSSGGVMATFYREYLEELFKEPDPEYPEVDWKYNWQHPCWQYLLKFLDSGEAKLYFTGISVDLLKLAFDICTLLVIRTPEWYKFHSTHHEKALRFHPNEEWLDQLRDLSPEGLDKMLGRMSYSDSDLKLMDYGLGATRMIPSAAATFWLAIDTLRDLRKRGEL